MLPASFQVHDLQCTYKSIEDLYLHAPLNSFARIGLSMCGFCVCHSYMFFIIHRYFYRLPRWRNCFIRLLVVHFVLGYLYTIFFIWYQAIEAVLLFQPHPEGSCHTVAPHLYKTLYYWHIFRLFSAVIMLVLLLVIVLIIVLCGVLIFCLPSCIRAPLMMIFQVRDHYILLKTVVLYSIFYV